MGHAESSVSCLPWIWVIEALASDQKVNMPILKDLASRASILPDDWGKAAREKNALRCLEDLFDQSHGNSDVSLTSDSRFGFDLSESCEHVLQRVLTEVSSTDVNMTGPELLKWDIHPFIMHKKASLSKCALELLKDTLIKGTHPLAPYLLDKSELAVKDQINGGVPVDDGDSNLLLSRFDVGGTDEHLTSFNFENGNRKVQGDSPHKTKLPSKRYRSTSTDENLVGKILVNIMKRDRDLNSNNKKQKPGPSAGQDFIPGKDLLENPCGGITAYTTTVLCNSAEELGGGLERVRNSENANDLLTRIENNGTDNVEELGGGLESVRDSKNANDLLGRIEQSNGSDNVEELGGGLESVRDSENPNDLVRRIEQNNTGTDNVEELGGGLERVRNSENANDLLRRIEQNNGTDNVIRHNEFHSYDNEMPLDVCNDHNNSTSANIACEPNFSKSATSSGAKRKICFDEADEDSEADTSSDTDRYHIEEIEVAVTKNNFLSSQLTFSEDTHVWTEQNLCMKCNKDGKLLHCCASACPFVVHENCFSSSANFDNEGNFYCPFCAYSRAITKYLEIKKKTSHARKKLSAFLSYGGQKEDFYLSFLHKIKEKKSRKKKSRDNRGMHPVGDTHGEKNLTEEDGIQANNEYQSKDHQTEKYVDNENQTNNQQIKEGLNDKQQAESLSISIDNEENQGGPKKMVKGCENVREIGQEKQFSADNKCDSDALLCKEAETVVVSWKHAEVETNQKYPQQIIDPREHPCQSNTDVDETSGAVNDNFVVSSYSMRFRSPQQCSPSYPNIRRSRKKPCPWTAEEEEILKEGVKRFANGSDKNLPWNQIFEFGYDVYQRNGRTLTNLQDKWRYICNRSQV